jgi:hypothetical protein
LFTYTTGLFANLFSFYGLSEHLLSGYMYIHISGGGDIPAGGGGGEVLCDKPGHRRRLDTGTDCVIICIVLYCMYYMYYIYIA